MLFGKPQSSMPVLLQLDTLAAAQAGRGGKYSGEVQINGTARDEKQFRQISCYVMQRDVLLESATVSGRPSVVPYQACIAWWSQHSISADPAASNLI